VHKEISFGVMLILLPILGVKSPENPNLGVMNTKKPAQVIAKKVVF